MRAVLRLGVAIAAAGLALGQAPALAQNAPAETTNTPAADAIGPRELQNFSLPGTVTRPPAEAPAPVAAPPAARTETPSRSPEAAGPRGAPTAQARTAMAAAAPDRNSSRASAEPPRAASSAASAPSVASITVDLPPAEAATGERVASAAPVPAAAPAFTDLDSSDGGLAAEQRLALWPWLLAAMALGAGAAFLFWRRSSREALAGGPRVDAFVAPRPEPGPRTRTPPAPPAAAPEPPQPVGIVSTRLRPWLDITLRPIRCVVEDERITFEFELSLFNSGSAVARDVLIEANMFNASPTQDTEIAAFFATPAGQGDRIPELPSLKRVNLRPQVAVARDSVRVLDAGGRRVFVPLIAFNGLYRWSSGQGQTSAAYLLGRETKGDKLAPFRLDLGPRIFRQLGARALPLALRK